MARRSFQYVSALSTPIRCTNRLLDRYDQPVNRQAALFSLLYLTAILYLSLYPWKFVPGPGLKSLVWFPLITRRSILDAFLNVVFYMPLGAAVFISIRRGAVGFLAALALGTLVSFSVEWTQLSIPGRFGNLTDLVCNSLGTLLGVAVAFVASHSSLASRLRVLYSPEVLLVGLWAVWQAFLLLPQYGPAIDISQEIVGLLILALLLSRRKIRAAAPLLLIWLLLEELRPFHFQSSPHQFWWLPFESWFVGALESYYGTFFGKLFFYTAILWEERRSGMRWIWALAAPGTILFAGELAQRYLPGRTPEITDVVLLAAGAVMLQFSEPSQPGRVIIKDPV
jgi:VanZ family protein